MAWALITQFCAWFTRKTGETFWYGLLWQPFSRRREPGKKVIGRAISGKLGKYNSSCEYWSKLSTCVHVPRVLLKTPAAALRNPLFKN